MDQIWPFRLLYKVSFFIARELAHLGFDPIIIYYHNLKGMKLICMHVCMYVWVYIDVCMCICVNMYVDIYIYIDR